MSQFVWLDYSERERRKMLAVINLLGEHDTRDELGIGSVRDAIADALFPGTSTIMTRARYFFLIPWIYQRLEKKRVNSAAIAGEARRAEIKLIDVIEDIARQNNFPSRQSPKPDAKPKRQQRRYRTGRNQHIGIKVTEETKEKFYKALDARGIPQGELLRLALDALEREGTSNS